MSDDIPLAILFGFLALLLLGSAFFSGTETALMTINRYRLRHKATSGHRGARLVEALLERPDRLIGLILFGNNLINIFAATLVTFIGIRLGGAGGAVVGSVLLTIVILIFAEVTPKTLAALKPERLAFPASYIYYPLLKFMYPVVWLINALANAVLRLFGVRPEDGDSDHLTIEELRTLVSEAGALLPRKRHQMLIGILELGQITVDDIMVPHNEIVGIDLDDDWENVLQTIRGSNFTRLPVWREHMDNVQGILHMKRLVQSGDLEHLDRARLKTLIEEPFFVPEGTPLNKQLVNFQRAQERTAFVVDEYGDIQGIVTMEDILEEIVGEFTTEPEPESEDVRRDEQGGWLVNASANVRELNRAMNWDLPTDGPKTLNGVILEQLEAIPEKGTGLVLNKYAVEIVSTTDNSVRTVRIRAPGRRSEAA